jgi:uroporphyrinogen III methyltransferase/synthase
LITVRGCELLGRAEVVVYDSLVAAQLLDLAPKGVLRVFVGKRAGRAAMSQSQINVLLIEQARLGKCVVRLKGGDPYVFGRGAEEAEALRRAEIPFEVVPGISAALGVSSYAGIPLTHRDDASAVALVTGHQDPANPANPLDWKALAQFPGTLVIYMGLANLDAITRALVSYGMPPETPVAVVESGTLSRQRVVQAQLSAVSAQVLHAGIVSPSLVIIGRVVNRREALSWFDRLPLAGKTVLVTRPCEDGAFSDRSLQALGAEVLEAPLVEIRAVEDPTRLDDVIQRLQIFHWIVFTSRHGVRYFLERLLKKADLRSLGGRKIAVIGGQTAQALEAFGLKPDLVAGSSRSEGLADALAPLVVGKCVLLARANRGRQILPERLVKLCAVEEVAVYEQHDATRLPSLVEQRLVARSIDWITVTSSAIAERLSALFPLVARDGVGIKPRLASLSPVTSETVRNLGWPVDVEAAVPTWQALVEAIVRDVGRPGAEKSDGSSKLAERFVPLPKDEAASNQKQDVEHQVGASERQSQGEVEQKDQREKAGDDHGH